MSATGPTEMEAVMPGSRPTQYRPSNITARDAASTQQRQDNALALREQGLSYAAIARRLGYRAAQGASAACAVARARRAEVNAAIGSVAPTSAPSSLRVMPSGRTFGVEFEFKGLTAEQARNAVAATGLAVYGHTTYTHTTMREWKVVTDGSVTGGFELVSPILRGQQGLDEMTLALNALVNAGGRVDTQCGFHVHVGMNGVNGTGLYNILNFYAANQNLMSSLVSRSRRQHSGYAVPLPTEERVRSRWGGLNHTTNRQLRGFCNGFTHDRYWAVNVAAFARHGTIEFRQHQGTLNAKKATEWVRLMLAMTEAGLAGMTTSYSSLDELLGVLAVDNTTREFITQRAAHFAGVRA